MTYKDSISVFLVKNILGLLYGIIEVYDCCYDIHLDNVKSREEKSEDNHQLSDINGVDNPGKDVDDKHKQVTI